MIFLSPRVAESDEQCDADMQQAIGRVRRPGQLKQVHVHHMIAKETEDVAVIEKWTGKLVVRRKDAILVSHKRKGDEWMGGPEKPPIRRKTG